MQISNLIIEELIHSGIACKGRKKIIPVVSDQKESDRMMSLLND